MSKITGLKQGKRRTKNIHVYVDDEFAISLSQETLLKENLGVGQEMGKTALAELADKDLRQRCFNSAVRFLGYRPRSESEIRQRLARHGFDDKTIDKTVTRLKDMGYVDDTEFARFWVENRESFSPRSRRLAKFELKRKGLGADIIEKAVSGIDEKDSAYRAAQSRARRLAALDYQDFRLRLGQYLGRRGFGYAIISEVIEKMWKELRKK
jgi:regulatory protein